MTPAAQNLLNPTAPPLQRVRALIALMLQLLWSPNRAADLEALFAEADDILAQHIFTGAIMLSGRHDLRATHEPYLVWRGATLAFGLRARPAALHPMHRIILANHRAGVINRYRRAIARRTRFSTRISYLHFANQRRRQGVLTTRRRATAAAPSHTPSRIAAPP